MIRQIQKRPPGSNASPLFLVHDASGTIATYRALGPLGRDVYAIADTSTECGVNESVQEMSRRYYALIKSQVAEGSILLGGWSLGGMITLQIAWIFARDPSIKVNGIIMVDSPFPDYRHVLPLAMGSPVSESGLGEARSKLELAMLRTADMLQKWRVPVWRREPQPYTVMLCARDYVNDDDNPALCLVDQFRESSTLGWNERARSLLVHESHSIEGHHFSIFEPRNVASVTEIMIAVAESAEHRELSD